MILKRFYCFIVLNMAQESLTHLLSFNPLYIYIILYMFKYLLLFVEFIRQYEQII